MKVVRAYVSVITGSSRIKVEESGEGQWKVWLTAKPIKGQANRQLIEVLSQHFSVAKSQVEILAGKTAKKKLVEILF